MKSKLKTPISYYGGKQAIIHNILPLVPLDHMVYTEAFFGGGTLYFAKEPVKNETINDLNDICINFYQVLKTRYKELKVLIDMSLISRTIHLQALYICQKKVPADSLTQAWAFWFCSNFSFACKIGGGIKYANDQHTIVTEVLKNKKKQFLEILADRLESTQIENCDAMQVLNSRNTIDAFHYIDTPYFNADQGHYAGWKEKDLVKYLDWCAEKCKGKFM